MTEAFDPQKHRYGMAYKYNNKIVYICGFDGMMEQDVRRISHVYAEECNEVYSDIFHDWNLTRFPEHDLIPKEDAMKMRDAFMAFMDDKQYGLGFTGMTGNHLKSITSAIAEFDAKWGDKG